MPRKGGERVKFVNVSNAKAILTALVTEVEKTGIPVCITRNGIPAVILRKVREEEIGLVAEEPPVRKGGKPRGSRKGRL
jgi:prevent-host-death family protein